MRIVLDRIGYDSGGVAVATFEIGERMVDFKAEQMPTGFFESLIPNAIVECEIENGKIISAEILYEETKQREEKMRKRLQDLNKRKNG